MKKLFAFTLAEIMIAMSIVGTVAAMTIPTLLYKRVKHEYSVKLKNFYSRMNNAVVDLVAENGSYTNMRAPQNGNEYRWYIDTIDPYFGHKKVNNTDTVFFADGSKLMFARSDTDCVDLIYDVNGNKYPNRYGFDRYLYAFCFSNRSEKLGNPNIFFGVKNVNSLRSKSRAKLLKGCQDTPDSCAILLEADGWEYLKDYPYRF